MRRKRGLSALPLCLWTCAFVFLPLLYVLFISFLEKGEYFGVSNVFTLDNYARMFSPLYAGILLNSLKIALESTLLSLLVGYPFAWFMANKPPKTRSLIMVLIVIPFWTSALMRTYGWMILLRNKGLINSALMALGIIEKPIRMLNTSGAVLLGTAYSMLPFMILPIYSSMEKLDPALREAARDLGAGPLRSFVSVVLPETLPGVMSGLAMTFVPSTGMFFISDLLGGGTNMLLGNLINNQLTVSRDWPFGAALSILMVGMTFCVMSLCRRVGGTDGTEVF